RSKTQLWLTKQIVRDYRRISRSMIYASSFSASSIFSNKKVLKIVKPRSNQRQQPELPRPYTASRSVLSNLKRQAKNPRVSRNEKLKLPLDEAAPKGRLLPLLNRNSTNSLKKLQMHSMS